MPRLWVSRLCTWYAIRRATVCQVLGSAECFKLMATDAGAVCYLSMSRCTTLAEYECFSSAFRMASPSITERCLPPVQPKAMVR